MRSRNLALALVVLGLLAVAPSIARAQAVANPDTLGAALAALYLTQSDSGQRITVATVTNALTNMPITAHVIWISGDPDDRLAALDFDCPLTPLETTYFVFESNGDGTAKVTFECSNLGVSTPSPGNTSNIITRHIPGENGIMFIALECQLGSAGCPPGAFGLRTRGIDGLVGDSTVLDFEQGSAFTVNAIHFQHGAAGNDGDRLYQFDGLEYSAFPSLLVSNYIAPDDDVSSEMVLFTLDAKLNSGGTGAPTALNGVAFNDDEDGTSGAIHFNTFVVVDLTDPPTRGFGTNIRRDFNPHLVGHVQLAPSSTGSIGDVQDTDPLTGGAGSLGARRRPAYGWLIQTVQANGEFNAGGTPPSISPEMAGSATIARTVGGSTFPATPLAGDVTSLNAGP